jgi:hypothetical protein
MEIVIGLKNLEKQLRNNMAQKKITLFRNKDMYGAIIYDGNKRTSWDKLTKQEQEDLLGAMISMYELYERFKK